MYQFTEDCLTGILEVDEEHRQLFDMINQALGLSGEERNVSAEAKSLLLELKEYAENTD